MRHIGVVTVTRNPVEGSRPHIGVVTMTRKLLNVICHILGL